MNEALEKIADKAWSEMIQALQRDKKADVAYRIFVGALKEAYTLNY